MTFSLYALLKAGLLFMNALAILHPGRFLRQHGLEQPDFSEGGGLKASISQTLAWTRGLRVFLVIANCLVVVVEVLFG